MYFLKDSDVAFWMNRKYPSENASKLSLRLRTTNPRCVRSAAAASVTSGHPIRYRLVIRGVHMQGWFPALCASQNKMELELTWIQASSDRCYQLRLLGGL